MLTWVLELMTEALPFGSFTCHLAGELPLREMTRDKTREKEETDKTKLSSNWIISDSDQGRLLSQMLRLKLSLLQGLIFTTDSLMETQPATAI